MAQYQIVLISPTKYYGTLPYCQDICDTLWHSIKLFWYIQQNTMAHYHTVMISVTHYGTVSIVLIFRKKYGTLPYCHDFCDTLWHSIKLSWYFQQNNMAHYHTVMISVTYYGTVSNCLYISNKITWHITILSWYLRHIMVQYHIVLISLTK